MPRRESTTEIGHRCYPAELHQIALSEKGTVPEWIQLLPAGTKINGIDGRKFQNPNPEEVAKRAKRFHTDLPLDWEHSTELVAPYGGRAPAAGWLIDFESRDGGAIWARVDWTDEGARSVAAREYRYISPVFHATSDGEVIQLLSAALTNRPNLRLTALNQLQTHFDEEARMKAKLLKILGLEANASDDEAFEAVTNLNARLQDAEKAKQAAPDSEKWAPRAELLTALNRVAEWEKAMETAKAEAFRAKVIAAVDQAVKDGKVTPAAKDYHLNACKDEAALVAFNQMVAASVPFGAQAPAQPQGDQVALNQVELDVCTAMGIAPEAFAAAKKE
jgi:phage I-like protein